MSAIAPEVLEQHAEILRALAHPMRLKILHALAQGEHSVGAIADATGLVQPTLSQQLALLRKADLVTARRVVKQVFYAVNPAALVRIRGEIDQIAGELPARRSEQPRMQSGAAVFATVTPHRS